MYSGLFDRLMALSLGMMTDRTGLSSSEEKFNCSSERSFCFHLHLNRFSSSTTDRVGRQHTELPFFSFMAGWEKERGQWFQRALVGYLLIPFHWKAVPTIFTFYTFSSLVAKIREMFPEADGNYMGFKRKGAEEKMSWKCSYTWNSAICMKYTRVDSLSRSDDRIDGFPQ